jgi:hypothetical protein
MTRLLVLTGALGVILAGSSPSSQSAIRRQATDGASPQPMSAAELAELGDPMFLLVLKDHAQEVELDAIEPLVLGPSGKRNLFVVDERLQDPAKTGSRRAVLTYTGTTQTVRLDPNIALSVSFGNQGITPAFIEAWGWDNTRSRYNYYKLDGSPATWKFRGSSDGADQLTDAQRAGTCLACHINGAPVMKELPIPWNNWHSFKNLVAYLTPTGSNHWAIAESPRFSDLRGAELLETNFILPSIRQFNGRRIAAGHRATATAAQEVIDGRRMLRPVFQTTEYNIGSAQQSSGLHPIPKPGTGPAQDIVASDMFFLNANLFAGGGIPQYEGLGIPEAREFGSLLRLKPAEYRTVVNKFKTRLGPSAGDTNFAWFVPEPSHVDSQMVDLLIRRGVITREFAAAALAVDLETPVFSKSRAALLAAVPDQFLFLPLNPGDVPAAHPDGLTRTVIERLTATKPAAGSAEADFLSLLQNPAPLDAVRSRVTAYLDRVRTRLTGTARQAEIDRLYGLMLQRRRDAVALIPALVESPVLFPAGAGQ